MSQELRLTTLALVALITGGCVSAAAQKTEVNGTIISRSGETLSVKAPSGGTTTVVLSGDTQTLDKTGVFGLRNDHLADTVLIPGLKVEIDGSTDQQGRVVAQTITVDGDDLEAAEMIQSGLHPTAEQVDANVQAIATNKQGVEANKVELASQKEDITENRQRIQRNMQDIEEHTQRFMALTDFDVKGNAVVKFDVGSSKLSSDSEEQLKSIVQTAAGLKGYIIEVMGYADATGNAEMNTKLSENRAKAVVTYLVQQGGIPVRHIVAPGAMGEYGPAAPNESKEGRAENRRVEVKVLVNKGVAGS
jgi:OOP family OmpA-OmpF porin